MKRSLLLSSSSASSSLWLIFLLLNNNVDWNYALSSPLKSTSTSTSTTSRSFSTLFSAFPSSSSTKRKQHKTTALFETRRRDDNASSNWEKYAAMTSKWDEYDPNSVLELQQKQLQQQQQQQQQKVNGSSNSMSVSSSSSSDGTAILSTEKTEIPQEHKVFHLVTLMLGTLWWYIFSSYEFIKDPREIFGLTEGPLYYGMSSYVTISQLCTYFFLWKLMTANSLREGQGWILACIVACVPADTIVIVFDPTGSKSLTVLAFTLVTIFYGVLLSYYVRQAASREPPIPILLDNNDTTSSSSTTSTSTQQLLSSSDAVVVEGVLPEQTMMTMASTSTGSAAAATAAISMNNDEDDDDLEPSRPGGIIQEIIHYRPPDKLQNFHMAIDFARAFGAFTVTVAAIKDQLLVEDENVSIVYYITLGIVVAHSAVEMVIATIFPGLNLDKYPSWLKFQAGMALFQMFAATYIAHEAPDAEDLSIWDDLVYSCLFGSAAAGLSEYIEALTEDVDFDQQLGMLNDNVAVVATATAPSSIVPMVPLASASASVDDKEK